MKAKYLLTIFFLFLFISPFHGDAATPVAKKNPKNILKNEWHRVYLATYPRSGNHWLRYLIEEATHVATGSVYCDQDEPVHMRRVFPWGGYSAKNGYEGNCRYPKPEDIVVVKTHFPGKNKTKFDSLPAEKYIRIVRHPLDAIHSHYLKMGYELPKDNKIPSAYVQKSTQLWLKFQLYWDRHPNVYTIRYEDLYNEPLSVFHQVMNEMGFKLPDEDIQRAVTKFPPVGGLDKHLRDYHPKDLEMIAKKLGSQMKKYGYKFAEVEATK